MKLQRIVNELEHFTFKVVYRRGAEHVDADALSRSYYEEHEVRFDQDIVDHAEHMFDHILSISSRTNDLLHISPEAIVAAQREEPDLIIPEGAFEDENGVRCRRSKEGQVQILVPKSLRERFLQLGHSSRVAGHFGQNRTLQLLKRFAYWTDMRADVTNYCKGCLVCQQSKIRKPDRAGKMILRTPEIRPAWSEIHVDHYGPLNRTANGNLRYILTVICSSSRSVRFIPVKDTSAVTTARSLLGLFCMESFPVKMTSDRGSAFTSALMKMLSKLLGMQLATTVAYRAKANGMAERPHSFLRACLCSMSNEAQTDWNEYLDLISLYYRSF